MQVKSLTGARSIYGILEISLTCFPFIRHISLRQTAPAAQVTTPASVDSAAVPQGATTTLAAPTPVSAVFDANANSAQPTRTTPVTAEQIQSQSHEATTDEKKKKKGKRGLFGLGKKK